MVVSKTNLIIWFLFWLPNKLNELILPDLKRPLKFVYQSNLFSNQENVSEVDWSTAYWSCHSNNTLQLDWFSCFQETKDWNVIGKHFNILFWKCVDWTSQWSQVNLWQKKVSTEKSDENLLGWKEVFDLSFLYQSSEGK